MSRNNDYTTGNLLDFAYFKENYRLIAIDFSQQTKLKDSQQINFIGRLKRQDKTTTTATITVNNNIFHHWKIRRNYYWIFSKLCEFIIIMETQKILNLLNSSENEFWKFATKKWYVIDSESNGSHSHHDPIKFLTTSIESSLCDYSDASILVAGNISVTRTIAAAGDDSLERKQPLNPATPVGFKNYAPFKNCRTEMNDTFADEADFTRIATPMYNLIEYRDNCSDTSGSLWGFKRDEITINANFTNNNDAPSIKYKAGLIANTEADGTKN